MAQLNSNALLNWYDHVKRDLPWRLTKDPYIIWVSEIILQQTRVDQGRPYFQRFVSEFPDVKSLADAPEDLVLKLWEGLGYYSRARNMRLAAQQIIAEYDGIFPNTFDELIRLKGIGPYTAAAISSIAFNAPEPSVDGNVLRVVSRFLANSNSIDEGKTKKHFHAFLKTAIPFHRPGDFNQAMMELGATVCLPRATDCSVCPLSNDCLAHRSDRQLDLPVRTKKVKKRTRRLIFFVPRFNGQTALTKRPSGDIWEGLYQFPMLEVEDTEQFADPVKCLIDHRFLSHDDLVTSVSALIKHVLTHQDLSAVFVHAEVSEWKMSEDLINCHVDELSNFAMPRLITQYLEKTICV